MSTVNVAKTKTIRIGRPPIYTGNLKRHILGLVRKFNVNQAMNILNAEAGTDLAKHRNQTLVPQPLGISYPTIYGYAKASGIRKPKGRPSLKQAA